MLIYSKLYFISLSTTNLHETSLSCLPLSDFLSSGTFTLSVIILLNSLTLGCQDHLNVCWLRSILSDTSMGSVSSTSSRGGTVTLSMANVQSLRFQSLGLSVGNCVDEQILYNGGGLYGPTSNITWGLMLLTLCLTSNTSSVFYKWYYGLEGKNIIHKFNGLGYIHSLDVVGDFACVLEMHAKV